MKTLQPQLSPGEIARRLNRPLHCVNYILESRRIEPIGRAGIVRIFAEDVVEQVRTALEEIEAKRSKRHLAAEGQSISDATQDRGAEN